MRVWLQTFSLALILSWVGIQNAHAVKLPALGGGAAVSQAGKSSTVAIGGAGNSVVRQPTPGSELGRVLGNRPYAVTPGDGASELARLSQKGRVPVAEKEVPAEIISPVGKDAIVGGAVGLITGGVPGAVIGAGTPLLVDWMSRSRVRNNPDTGAPELMPSYVCTIGPCYEYSTLINTSWYRDPAAACTSSPTVAYGGGNYGRTNYRPKAGQFPTAGGQWYCEYDLTAANGSKVTDGSSPLPTRSAQPMSPTWFPATPQAIRDQLYKQGVSEAIVKELLEQGSDLEVGPTRVTGPSEITGDKRVKTLPDGSKIEEQDTIRYGYDGSKITELSRRTTTTNISPTGERTPAGQTETTSGESEPTSSPNGDSGSKEPEVPPTDTPLPPVPDLYTRKYPQGMEGIYDQYKDQLKGTPLGQLAKQLMPNVGDGGTCPTWPLNLDLADWALYGVHDVAPPCWIWDVAKAILILSALLLARSLIFGG